MIRNIETIVELSAETEYDLYYTLHKFAPHWTQHVTPERIMYNFAFG